MTAQFTGTTSPRSDGHAAEVVRLYQEGIIAGTLGAATIALWFLVLDILAGRPLYTPNVLGIALFKGSGGLVPPAYVGISLGIVVAFTAIHWLVFALIGGLASRLLAACRREN